MEESLGNQNNIPRGRKWGLRRLLAAGAFIYGTWGLAVLASGAGFNPLNLALNFERIGQLGDAFGVVGAAMATAAAVFTWDTLSLEREETARLRIREAKRDGEDLVRMDAELKRQSDRDLSQRKTAAESTFFRLLDSRLTLLDNVQITFSDASDYLLKDTKYTGTAAISKFLLEYSSKRELRADGLSSHEDRIRAAFERHFDALGHYFRFTYSIIQFADTKFGKDAYEYVRILRAQLSDSEQLIIALNCLFGHGQGSFKQFTEKFALLNNVSKERIEIYELRERFSDSAFSRSPTSA
ncbi:putative phage abortive infection protein [Sphingomonas sp. LR59]|uniref:putative phage abortive infection protein n=1 Tax=Sphingomonas sp. LR59 TaxID=3050232 RepID=UPI002FE0C20E